MPVIIEEVFGEYKSIKVFLETSKNKKFYMRVTQNGLEFYRGDNSAGNLLGKPIIITPDKLFNLIGDSGDKKPFKDRKEVIKGMK